jgi:nucleoside-diphosphate-sugar epimerase
MKVFVTGAEGFIGSHLVERLIRCGCKVKAFTFYNFRGSVGWLDSIDKKLLKDLHIISGDIRDYNFFRKTNKRS